MSGRTLDQSKPPTIDQAYEYFANMAPGTAIGNDKRTSKDPHKKD